MSQSILQMEKDFFDYIKKISAYNEALALIYWDLRTGAPKQGINQRAEVIGVLSSEVYKISVSEDNGCLHSNTYQVKRHNLYL